MPILFIAGNAKQDIMREYLTELSKEINQAVYFNINHFYSEFEQPASSPFTDQYSYDQRIKHPSHAALLGLAFDNVPLNKLPILDGHLDYELTAQIIEKNYPHIKENGIKTLFFFSSNQEIPKGLDKLTTESIFMIDVDKPFASNIAAVLHYLTPAKISEEKHINKNIIAMTAGVPGSAKTAHFKLVSLKIKSVYLDTDIPTFSFLDAVKQDLSSNYYTIHVRSQRYKIMFEFAKDNIRWGNLAILDGCFGDKLTGQLVKSHLVSDYITTVFYFHCTGPTQFKRVIDRNAKRDFPKLAKLPEDRRDSLKKHLIEFAQVGNLPKEHFINSEKEDDLKHNVESICETLASDTLRSLAAPDRKNPFNEKTCNISVDQALCDLNNFHLLLSKIKEEDELENSSMIPLPLLLDKPFSCSHSRNYLWSKQGVIDEAKLIQRMDSIIDLATKDFKTGHEVNSALIEKLKTSPSFIDKLHKNEQVMELKEGKISHAWLQYEDKAFGGYNANKIKGNPFIAASGPKNINDLEQFITAIIKSPYHIEEVVCIGNVMKGTDFFNYYHFDGELETPLYRISSKVLEKKDHEYLISDLTIINKKDNTTYHLKVNNLMVMDNHSLDIAYLLSSNNTRYLDILLGIHQSTREKEALVHCKYGVGRTGFFIYLMKLMEQYDFIFHSNDNAVVAKCFHTLLDEIRKNRPQLVTELAQFKAAIKGAFYLHYYQSLVMKKENALEKEQSSLKHYSGTSHFWPHLPDNKPLNQIEDPLLRHIRAGYR
jgi:protein tyrosine phosphatase